MAIRGGSVIHVGNNAVLLSRLQTAGPGTVNIKRTTVYELGNYLSVGQVDDIPDLSFSMDSLDVSCAMEALLLDKPVQTTHSFDLAAAKVLNVKSAFKPGRNATVPFGTVGSAAVPCLYLESVSYKFGVGSTDATQMATFKGDSLYYNPGSTYVEGVAGSGTAGQTIVTAQPAYAVVESGVQRRILAVTAGDRRLLIGSDYTEAYGTVTASAAITTLTIIASVPSTEKIYISYASPTVESFPQSVHALVSGIFGTLTSAATAAASTISVDFATVAGNSLIIDDTTGSAATEVVQVASVTGAGPYVATLVSPLVNNHLISAPVAQYVPTVRPAAIRGRDIDIYIGPAFPSGTAHTASIGAKRHGVQQASADWKVTLQNDEELGNYHYVSIDADVPVVTGSIAVRPQTYADLLKLVQDLSGVTVALESATPTTAPPMDVQMVLKNPLDGRVLKRLHIPDARFSLPGYSGKVQQKLDLTAAFTSDTGAFMVYDS